MKRGVREWGSDESERKRHRSTSLQDLVRFYDGDDAEFIRLWKEKFRDKATIEEVLAVIEEGPNQGKSALWILAKAQNGTDELLLNVWNKFKAGSPRGVLGRAAGYFLTLAKVGPTPEQIALFKKALFAREQSPRGDGKSVFWLLADLKSVFFVLDDLQHHLDLFLDVFDQFKQDIPLDELTYVPFGEKESVLTLFINESDEGSRPLMRILDELQKRLGDLFSAKIACNESLLSYITRNRSRLFKQVWERFNADITLDHLFQIENGKTPLEHLIDRGRSSELMQVLTIFKARNMSAALLERRFENGEGLIEYVLTINRDLFIQVYESFEEHIKLEHLFSGLVKLINDAAARPASLAILRQVLRKNGFEITLNNGKTLIEYLLKRQYIEIFDQVLNDFSEQITLDHLFSGFQSLLHAPRPTLMRVLAILKERNQLEELFSQRMSAGSTVLCTLVEDKVFFNQLFQTFGEHITFDHLIMRDASSQYPLQKIASMHNTLMEIWYRLGAQAGLALFVSHKLFYELFKLLELAHKQDIPEKYKDSLKVLTETITLEQLLMQIEEGENKGTSILWLAARDAANHAPKAFLTFYERFKDELKLMDLLTIPQNSGMSMLTMFSVYAYEKKCIPMMQMLKNMLQQDPGIMGVSITRWRFRISSVTEILSQVWFETDVPALISARNNLFTALDGIKDQVEVSAETVQSIFDFAVAAYNAGYFNAFYDVGYHFDSKKNHKLACQAYEHVPPNSRHYQAVSLLLAEHYFAQFVSSIDGGYDLLMGTQIPEAGPQAGKIYLEKNGENEQKFILKKQDGEVVDGVIEISAQSLKSEILKKIAPKANLDINSKRDYLRTALDFTLKISDPHIRNEQIQKIVPYYIGDGDYKAIGLQDPVLEEFIFAMNESTGVTGCLKLFDAIKERKKQELAVVTQEKRQSVIKM